MTAAALNWPDAAQQSLLEDLLAGRRDRVEAWCAARQPPFDRPTAALLPMAHLVLGGATGWPADHYATARARNEHAIDAGLEAAEALRDAGIPAVLVKGVPLCLFYHRDLGARPMADADIVVHAGDLVHADALLRARGWPRRGKAPGRALRYLPAMDYQHPRASLDVQRHPFHLRSGKRAVQRFWAHCAEREVRGRRVLVPDATYLLILTCWHARKPESSVARWPLDAHAIMSGGAVDWDELIAAIELAEIVAPVRDALAYLARAFGLSIPTAALARLTPTRADAARYERLALGFKRWGAPGMVAERWDELVAVAGLRGALRFPTYFAAANAYYWKGELTLANLWSRLAP